jgi:tRNA threonylcarbamoyladenosine biosynthesis protein TsaB
MPEDSSLAGRGAGKNADYTPDVGARDVEGTGSACGGLEWCRLNILALDTSSEYCSVALLRDGALDAREVHAGQRHSELVLPMVDEMLARHGLDPMRLDGIAYGAGPGSFTGLRIACGVTQGLAFAAGIPVVGVETLLAMAECAQVERVVCCIDARMSEIYHAAYQRQDGAWRTVHGPGVYPPQAAPLLPPGTWVAVGNAFAVYRDVLTLRYAGALGGIDAGLHARAHEIARLAAPAFRNGRAVDAAQAVPLYIRDKVALTMREQP